MIKFEQIKKACIQNYSRYLKVGGGEDTSKTSTEAFKEVECLDSLLNTLDDLGFDGREGMQFIFDSIVKD